MATLFKPDLLWWEGRFRDDLALAVSDDGLVQDLVRGALPGLPVRLQHRAMLPGLVNGHSHAFQRLLRGRTELVASGAGGDDFWSWRELMYQAAGALEPEELYTASRQAFLEMALAGITTVGEFHYLHHAPDGQAYEEPNELAHQVIRAARDVGLRICLLRVAYARAGFEVPENPRQRRFVDISPDEVLVAVDRLAGQVTADPLVTVGLAPHSVRALSRGWLERFAKAPAAMPVHMHVAEQPREVERCLAEHGRRPVELLSDVGLLSARFTAVHGIHLSEAEVALLGQTGATVCACPTTEQNLGDGVVPADALIAGGVALSLGSDSQATIHLLEEARALEGNLRLVRGRRAVLDPGGGRVDGLAERLFRAATDGGAHSLGLKVGTLAPGTPADFFTVDLRHPCIAGADPSSLLSSIVFGAEKSAIREVAVQGRLVVQGGQHPLTSESFTAFAALSKRLFS